VANLHRQNSDAGFKAVAWTSTIIFVALSLFAAPAGSTYKWSFAILTPILWLVYFARHRLALHPFHFALFAAALVLHNFGAMGFYRRKFSGFEFDLFVHFYFGVVAGLVFYRGFRHFYGLSGWKLWLGVALFTLGVSGVHELVEWSTTLAMGPEKGMLKADPNDPYDTQKDLLNNLAGALLAMAIYTVATRSRGSAAVEPDTSRSAAAEA
jgi:uncharacterized membrane protein YjdF